MPLPAPGEVRHCTKQEFVYRTLRNAIIRCEMPPGERLIIDELARRLEVSAIPVREALQLLQSERLVVVVPHTGATVAPISRDSIVEVFTVLEGLEIVATREAAQRATAEDVDALAEIVAAMDRALAAGKYNAWVELNSRFHLGFSRIAGMPMLEEMMAQALDRWERVRRYYFKQFKGLLGQRLDVAQQEHHALLEAMKQRNVQRLEETIRVHNQGALATYTSSLEK